MSKDPHEELWIKTIETLNELLLTLAENNKTLRQDAEVFRSIVQEGVRTGAVRFDKGINGKKH